MPEKTADRFVEHRGERIYRTGDLGRVDEQGEIVYLGRADDEVKIRGHRVDLGEIDSLLLDDPAVESAVAAMLPVGGAEELVAYVTRRGAEDPGDEALVARLHERLRATVPDYMVPGYLEVLPTLPTMPSAIEYRHRKGIITNSATTRGSTRNSTIEMPKVRSASTSSVTFIVESCAA